MDLDLDTKHGIQEQVRQLQSDLSDLIKVLEKALYSLEGHKFGKLTVLKKNDKIKLSGYEYARTPAYECVCECGQVVHVTHDDLINMVEVACVDCTES